MAQVVRYSGALIQRLERILRSAFNPHSMLTKDRHKTGPFQICLANEEKYAQTDDGSDYRVVEILSSGQPTVFYFAFVAEFGFAETEKNVLLSASLPVFHDVYAGELAPLFRAEWDYNAAVNPASKHAQPHWHFIQSPARLESIVRTASSEPQEFTSVPTSLFTGLTDCGRVHFAMTSLSQKTIFESTDDFPEWFEALTSHIAEQITYLVRKDPGGITGEFVPDNATT